MTWTVHDLKVAQGSDLLGLASTANGMVLVGSNGIVLTRDEAPLLEKTAVSSTPGHGSAIDGHDSSLGDHGSTREGLGSTFDGLRKKNGQHQSTFDNLAKLTKHPTFFTGRGPFGRGIGFANGSTPTFRLLIPLNGSFPSMVLLGRSVTGGCAHLPRRSRTIRQTFDGLHT